MNLAAFSCSPARSRRKSGPRVTGPWSPPPGYPSSSLLSLPPLEPPCAPFPSPDTPPWPPLWPPLLDHNPADYHALFSLLRVSSSHPHPHSLLIHFPLPPTPLQRAVSKRVLGSQRPDTTRACTLFLLLLSTVCCCCRQSTEETMSMRLTHGWWINGLMSFLAVCFNTRGYRLNGMIMTPTSYSQSSRFERCKFRIYGCESSTS
jgi:hypothetical protein